MGDGGLVSYVEQWDLGCVREESFERSMDEAESWFPGEARSHLEPLAEHGHGVDDVLSPLSVRGLSGDADGIDEIDFSDRPSRQVACREAPASVPRLSLNNFGSNRNEGPKYEAEEGSDGLNSRDDSVTECDSRPITARSSGSIREDGAGSREGSRDSRRPCSDDMLSDGQPLSHRSQDMPACDNRERRPLSARGFGGLGAGSDPGGSDASAEPVLARTTSSELSLRSLPQFSPRFLSPRVGPHGGLGGGGGSFASGSSFASARPSPRLHSVTAAGPRSILSPRCGPGTLLHPQADITQGALGGAPWGFPVLSSPRQRQSEAMWATMSLAQHKDLDNAARRVAQLEELLQKAQEENAQLQADLAAARGGSSAKDDDKGGVQDEREGHTDKIDSHTGEKKEETPAEKAPTSAESDESGKSAGEASTSKTCAATQNEDACCSQKGDASSAKALDVFSEKASALEARASALEAKPAAAAAAPASPRLDELCMSELAPSAEHWGAVVSGEGAAGGCMAKEKEEARSVRGTLEEGQEFARKWEIAACELQKMRCIGRGAAGAVYEGRWCGSCVAIKELELDGMRGPNDAMQDEMLLSFRHEISRMAYLRHPNVVAFYGVIWCPPALAIVTELAVGDLRGFINSCCAEARAGGGAGGGGGVWERRSLVARLRAAQQASAGVLYLHEQTPPIVHRDIKPENFLVGQAGDIKVCDFGLSRDMHRTRMNTEHAGGSSIYIAPEVHRGQNFDTGCDVYAMGLVVWELLALQRPFHEVQEHVLPGLVGWGGQRPSMLQILEAAEARKDTLEGAALPPLVRAIEAAWMQDAHARPGLEDLHRALSAALKILEEDGILLRKQQHARSPTDFNACNATSTETC